MAYTTIDKPTDYFNTKIYAGNSSTQSLTGIGFQPDWVWIKNRSDSRKHNLYDSVRGATKRLVSNDTVAEDTAGNGLTSFDSDGFTTGSEQDTNHSGNNFVAWNWLAGGTASSNTDGSITSSVSANTTAGFSIGTYTGTGSNATIGHGLGATPSVIFVKKRNSAGDWNSFHNSLGNTGAMQLDHTGAFYTNSTIWNDTSPTSSVFTVGTWTYTNASSDTYVFYAFAEKKGFSKFGSYTGNGTSGVDGAGDGTFVYTGFKPSMIIIKPSSAVENWQILDNKRPGFNESDNLAPNNSAAENTGNDFVDLVSNGFKLRSGTYSASGVSYIYMAFAENPFVTSTGIPTTAR
jgi:hypothetical protein